MFLDTQQVGAGIMYQIRFIYHRIKWVFILLFAFSLISGCQWGRAFLSTPSAMPRVELVAAEVDNARLSLSFHLYGLAQTIRHPIEIDDWVCRPYLHTREHISLEFESSEVHWPNAEAKPIQIVYHYRILSPLKGAYLHLDTVQLTIGPCAPTDFDESNVVKEIRPLLLDYRTQVAIPLFSRQP